MGGWEGGREGGWEVGRVGGWEGREGKEGVKRRNIPYIMVLSQDSNG